MESIIHFLLSLIGLLQFWVICDTFEEGVVLRFGQYNRTIKGGFHWLLPFGIDRPMVHEVILTTRQMDEQSLTTKDGKKIVISTICAYILTDIKKILLEIEEAETVLENYSYGIVADLVTTNDKEYLFSQAFKDDYFNQLFESAEELGMKIKKAAPVNLQEIRTIRLMLPSQSIEM